MTTNKVLKLWNMKLKNFFKSITLEQAELTHKYYIDLSDVKEEDYISCWGKRKFPIQYTVKPSKKLINLVDECVEKIKEEGLKEQMPIFVNIIYSGDRQTMKMDGVTYEMIYNPINRGGWENHRILKMDENGLIFAELIK